MVKLDRLDALVAQFEKSLADYDTVYPDVLDDADLRGMKLTEEKMRVAVRNELRARGFDIPEVVRWKLRVALNGVEEYE